MILCVALLEYTANPREPFTRYIGDSWKLQLKVVGSASLQQPLIFKLRKETAFTTVKL